MADETLAQRLERLGVDPAKSQDVALHLNSNGVSIDFHRFVDDNAVRAKLASIPGAAVAKPEPTRGADFERFLGGLAGPLYDAMAPDRKLALIYEFKSSKAAPERSPLHDELVARHGAGFTIDKLSPAEKLAFAHATGATSKPGKPAKIAATPALMALPAHRRLEARDAIMEAAKLQGSQRSFDVDRLASLRARWPGIVP